MLTKSDRDYLRSLVRMDIRKRERAIAKFAPKPGQSSESAAEALNKLTLGHARRMNVLLRLRARDSHYGSEVAYRDAARVLRQTRLKGSAS